MYSRIHKICRHIAQWFIASVLLVCSVSAFAQPAYTMSSDSFSTTSSLGGNFGVLGNDLYFDGINTVPAIGTVTMTSGSLPLGVSLDSSGGLFVPPGTAVGTYTFSYSVTDGVVTGNSTGSLTIGPTTAPVAVGDTLSMPTTGGFIDVVTNDTPFAPGVDVTIVNPAGLSISITASPMGNTVVNVAAVAAGSYSPTYKICYIYEPTNCSATVPIAITVVAPTPVAVADTATVPSTGGTVSVLSNDTVNAVPASSSTELPVIVSNGGITGLTVNGSGQLVVPAFAAGTYPVTYQLCYINAPTNCSSTVTATITISAAPLPTPVAVADTATVSTTGGLVSVMSNDTVNALPASSSSVMPSIVTDGGIAGLTINGAGQLVVPGFAAGTYTATYKICYISAPLNCSATVNVTITITTAPTTAIVAKADAITVSLTSAASADTTLNVLANDTLNGVAITNTTLITATLTSQGGLTTSNLSTAGLLTLPKGTYTANVYTLTYQICQASAPNNCSSASITVTIQATAVVTGVGGVKIPPTVPGSPSTTTVIRGSNGSPILFSGGSTTAAGAANQPIYYTGVKIGFGYGFGSLVGSTQEVNVNQPQDPPPFNAQVYYSGSGNLRARWEVIQPGDPDPTVLDLMPEEGLTTIQLAQRFRYTFIERVYAYLAPVGSYFIDGPNPKQLPRSRLGTYRVLLRLESTGAGAASNFVIPMLTYRVLSGGKSVADNTGNAPKFTDAINQANFAPSFFKSNNEATVPKFSIESVSVSAPNAGHHFAQTEPVVMRWKLLPNTKVDRWQIEVRDSQRRLLTAAWVAGKDGVYSLSPVIRVGLPSREELSWRVVGLTSSSNPVATSSWMFFSVD